MLFKWEFSLNKKTVTTNRSIEQRLVPAKSKIPSYTDLTPNLCITSIENGSAFLNVSRSRR